MSAVSAAVSAASARARRPGAEERRPASVQRPNASGRARRRPAAGVPAGLVPAAALLAASGLGAFAVLCLPALRTELAIGWLPLWLVAAPLAGWAALCLVRARDGASVGVGLGPVATGDRPRLPARPARRGVAQAVRSVRGEGGRAAQRRAA